MDVSSAPITSLPVSDAEPKPSGKRGRDGPSEDTKSDEWIPTSEFAFLELEPGVLVKFDTITIIKSATVAVPDGDGSKPVPGFEIQVSTGQKFEVVEGTPTYPLFKALTEATKRQSTK